MKRNEGVVLMSDKALIGTRPVTALPCTAAPTIPFATSSVRSALASPSAYALTATYLSRTVRPGNLLVMDELLRALNCACESAARASDCRCPLNFADVPAFTDLA